MLDLISQLKNYFCYIKYVLIVYARKIVCDP